jgi:ankyrin repeat protein
MEFAISANFRQSRSKLTPITPTVETTIVRLPSNPKSKKRFTSVRSSDSDFNDSSDQSLGSPAFALHQSIFEGRFKQIHYFLKMGLSANSKDMYGRTSLMIACLCDFEEYGIQVTKLLMKYGADINVKDSLGQSVAYLAVSERRDNYFNFLMDNHSVSIDYKQKDNDGMEMISF